MSLNFGIYLVEQRIISPEQFCGLVKIQQESGATLASVAIRKNMLTIKQVANILDQQEMTPQKSFAQIAIETDYLDGADAEKLVAEQQNTTPTIRKLVQECGLLTDRQCSVLFQHYLRIGTRPINATQPAAPASQAKPVTLVRTSPAPTPAPAPVRSSQPIQPRAPKFKQRPVIVSPYTSPATK